MPAIEIVHRSLVALAVVAAFALLRPPSPTPTSMAARSANACDGRSFVAPTPTSAPQARASLQGKLLVAAATMPDPTFAGTRVYLLEHDETGALGVIVNRPLQGHDLPLALHDGGPVGKDVVLFVHSDAYRTPETKLIEPGVAVTTSAAVIDDVRSGAGPKRWLLAWGYSGWAPGQLEGEIAAGAWRVEEAGAEVLPER